LGERLDEDERIVREANTSPEMVTGIPRSYAAAPVALHIAEFADPARVLREIDAKRAIVDAYLPPGEDPHPGEPCINYEGQDPAEYSGHDGCWRHLEASKRLLHHDYVLRLLALPYADRDGYRAEWAPTR
jgi:hypothetical protein